MTGRAARSFWDRVYVAEEDERSSRTAGKPTKEVGMAGIGIGGILVILGIILAIVWNFWIGLIIALVGLIAFGGFVRGRWY
jgi:hypothetical protein